MLLWPIFFTRSILPIVILIVILIVIVVKHIDNPNISFSHRQLVHIMVKSNNQAQRSVRVLYVSAGVMSFHFHVFILRARNIKNHVHMVPLPDYFHLHNTNSDL